MAYTKTNWVNDESPDIDADNLNKMEQGIYDAQYPDGGSEGQLLARTATGKAWVDAPNSAVWGLIQGTLSDQTDLAIALENTGKVDTVNGIQPNVLTKNVQVDVELTKAEYDALPSSKLTDDINYYIKDGTDIPAASVISASGVAYDNTQSGMSATNVQSAVDELKSNLTSSLNGVKFVSDGINAGQTKTYTVSNASRFLVYAINNFQASFMALGYSDANGNVGKVDILAPSSVSFTTATNSLIITNNSSRSIAVTFIVNTGSVTL